MSQRCPRKFFYLAQKLGLQAVAQLACVPLTIANQVMRGAGEFRKKPCRKVLHAAKELDYVPDGRAAAMRSGENREIAMVIHQFANPFNAEVISGVRDLPESEGYLNSVFDSRGDPEKRPATSKRSSAAHGTGFCGFRPGKSIKAPLRLSLRICCQPLVSAPGWTMWTSKTRQQRPK